MIYTLTDLTDHLLGKWKGFVEIPDYTLEDSEVYLEGENQKRFLAFLRKMLQWEPEKRPTALELLQDEWLNSA